MFFAVYIYPSNFASFLRLLQLLWNPERRRLEGFANLIYCVLFLMTPADEALFTAFVP